MDKKNIKIPAEVHTELKIESALSGEDIQTIAEKAIKEELKKRKAKRK